MRKQKNMPPMKQEEKNSRKNLNETEANNLPEPESKTPVLRALDELGGRINELREDSNGDSKRPRLQGPPGRAGRK